MTTGRRSRGLPPWKQLALSTSVMLLAAGWAARRQHRKALASAYAALQDRAGLPLDRTGGPAETESLPPPVARYLAHVLPRDGRQLRLTRYEQSGRLRTDARSGRWMRFEATQVTRPATSEFVWSARVRLLPFIHLEVCDSLRDGRGATQLLFASALPVARSTGRHEMDSGALHRFLAEAPWYPTALLPSDRLHWSAVDGQRAVATLRQGDTRVALEFRFNEEDEVASVYTPGRWGRFGGTFRQLPWEGRFGPCEEVDGVRVPTWGEVGWYMDGRWDPVWQGRIVRSSLAFD